MRKAIWNKTGQWRMVDKVNGVCHLRKVDWTMDRNGHWPMVEIGISSLKEAAVCPCCKERLLLNEMECLFGVTRREKNDILVLVCWGGKKVLRNDGRGELTKQ